MLLKKTNSYWSKAIEMVHIGTHSRSEKINQSNFIAEYLVEQLKGIVKTVDYDLGFNGTAANILYTEILGGHGCIMLKTANPVFNSKMLDYCTATRDFNYTEPCAKYDQLKLPPPHDLHSVVVLPGSNKLKHVFREDIIAAYNRGAFIKPHPMTNKKDIASLKSHFKEKLLYKDEDGGRILKAAKTIYTYPFSELGIYAALNNKNVAILGSEINEQGTYYHFYSKLHNIKTIVRSPLSGIITPTDDYKEQIDCWISAYKRLIKGKKPV